MIFLAALGTLIASVASDASSDDAGIVGNTPERLRVIAQGNAFYERLRAKGLSDGDIQKLLDVALLRTHGITAVPYTQTQALAAVAGKVVSANGHAEGLHHAYQDLHYGFVSGSNEHGDLHMPAGHEGADSENYYWIYSDKDFLATIYEGSF